MPQHLNGPSAADHREPANGAATGGVVRALTVGMFAVAAIWIPMSFTYPFGWDQGIFAWAGDVILRGGLPYVDAWDLKGPLVYYVYALAQALFGVHLWSIRLIDAALLIAATVSLVRAARSLTDPQVARWVGMFFFAWYASQSYWHTAQPDGWAAMLLMVALGPLLSARHPRLPTTMWLIGVSIGVITLFKPLGAIFLLLPVVHVTLTDRRRPAAYLAVLAGWVSPILLTAAYFAWHGALGELISVHIRYAAAYAAQSPGGGLRGLVDYFLTSRVVPVSVPLILYGGWVLRGRSRPAAWLLAGWAALAIVVAAVQNRFYAYHWLPLLPAASLLAAAGLHDIRDKARPLAIITGGVILLHCFVPIVFEEGRFVAWLAGLKDRDAYYAAYGEPGDDMRATRWLREQGQPGSVFVFGWNSGVAWLSGRETVSRFGFSMPLLIDDGAGTRARYRAELLEAIGAAPPRYIVVGVVSGRILGTPHTIADFPELAQLVIRDYREVQRFGTLAVYERTR